MTTEKTQLPPVACLPLVLGDGTTHWYACPHCRGQLDLCRPTLAPHHIEKLRELSECYGDYRLGPTSREAIRSALAALGEGGK
jgi:hypothetical protein